MSCMIQKPENTAMIASYIARLLNMGHEVNGMSCPEKLGRTLYDLGCSDKYHFFNTEKIYNKLIEMNHTAWLGRYSKIYITEYYEYITEYYEYKDRQDDISKHIEYKCENNKPQFIIKEWHYKMLKMIQFYNYQCNEDATCKSDLYKGMKELEKRLCYFIVENSTEYINQEWE